MTLKKTSIRDELNFNIREGILNGHYPAGKLLTIKELSSVYKVSKTVLIEVLIELECQGLIKIIQQKGVLVTEIETINRQAFTEMRILLEVVNVKKSLKLIKEENIFELENILKLHQSAINRHDEIDCFHLSRRFHEELFRISNSEYIWKVIYKVKIPFDRLNYGENTQTDKLNSMFQDHVEILKLIRNKDEVNLENTLTEHIVKDSYWSQLNQVAI